MQEERKQIRKDIARIIKERRELDQKLYNGTKELLIGFIVMVLITAFVVVSYYLIIPILIFDVLFIRHVWKKRQNIIEQDKEKSEKIRELIVKAADTFGVFKKVEIYGPNTMVVTVEDDHKCEYMTEEIRESYSDLIDGISRELKTVKIYLKVNLLG